MPAILPVVTVTGTTPASALSELIRRTRFLLEDYPMQVQLNRGLGINAAVTGFDGVTPGGAWSIGDRMEFDDGTGEQALIMDLPSTNIFVVRRGAYGTTAAAHDDGVYLLKNPRFGYQQITQALTSVITGWLDDWVWVPVAATATPSTTATLYQMPATFAGWISVTQASIDGFTLYNYGTRGSGRPVLVRRGLPSSLSSTGLALAIPTLAETTNALNITYGARVDITTVADGPVAEAAINGACAWLMGGKSIFRSAQDVSQGDATVTPTTFLQDATYFYNQFVEYRRVARRELEQQGPLHTS